MVWYQPISKRKKLQKPTSESCFSPNASGVKRFPKSLTTSVANLILVLVKGGRDYIIPRRHYIPGIKAVYTANWVIIYLPIPPVTRI